MCEHPPDKLLALALRHAIAPRDSSASIAPRDSSASIAPQRPVRCTSSDTQANADF